MKALLVCLALALPLAADPLADVRASLVKLTAREPIKATYELQHAMKSEGKLDNDAVSGKAVVELEGDASGFRVIFPRGVLDQLDREQDANSHNPSLKVPTATALREIDPVETSNAIDFAPVLLRMLDGAKLVADANGTWAGKPARTMVLRLADKLDADDAKRMKIAENKLTLWLGPDLVPLAAEHIESAKISFLIFKAELSAKRSWHFAHVADRLVRVRHDETKTTNGMGQHGNETLTAFVRVH